MTTKKPDVFGGGYYAPDDSGRLQPVDHPDGAPIAWVCRRLSDFPGAPPAGYAVTTCCGCTALIAFNPGRTVDAPKVCMQCAGLQPLPFD
jgi:hypothetical protein